MGAEDMTPAEALHAAQAANVHVALEGTDLVLRAPAPPPVAVLDALKQHKTGIVALIRRTREDWTAEDWEAFFDERAGIAENDGGLPHRQAEELAFEHCVEEWLRRHPVRSSPGFCLSCGCAEDVQGTIVPFGIETSRHAWLHSGCWPAWYAGRKADAITALVALGITPPAAFLENSKAKQMAAGIGSDRGCS
jgi:hypothetical protein